MWLGHADMFRGCHGQEYELGVLALPFTSCETLGKSHELLEHPVPHHSMETVMVPGSQVEMSSK